MWSSPEELLQVQTLIRPSFCSNYSLCLGVDVLNALRRSSGSQSRESSAPGCCQRITLGKSAHPPTAEMGTMRL